MTVKKAIIGLDFLIQNKREVKTGLIDPQKSWNQGEPCLSGLANGVAAMLQLDINSLHIIKKQLLPEQHRTKIVCRHPKKMQDIAPDGQKYCMNCNANL